MNLKRGPGIGLLFLAGYCTTTFLVALTVNEGLAPKGCLPAYLKERTHVDYSHLFRLLRWVPWSWTSWCFVEPPILILGNQTTKAVARDGSSVGPKPIPGPGEWQLSLVQVRTELPICFLPYFACTTKRGTHFSIGCRWDDADHYYIFPRIAVKPLESSKE